MSRLEEIKEHVEWTTKKGLVPMIDDSDLDWLIQQADRVEELKEENRELNMEIGRYAGKVFDIKQTLGANIAELGILTVRMFGGKDDE